MNKQEFIEWMKSLKNIFGNKSEYIKIDTVIELASELDEPQKQVVPQFVADWIERNRGSLFGLNYDSVPSEIYDWVYEEEGNLKKLHLACAIGYTVEKEKRYLVKIIGITNYNSYLNYYKEENKWTIESSIETDRIRTKHTRKELEEAGFGEMFDSTLFEVEEVEE